MKNFTTYLSTAPVVALIWFTFTAGLLIEVNRFFPDPLVFSFRKKKFFLPAFSQKDAKHLLDGCRRDVGLQAIFALHGWVL
jgi:photosystem I subunit 9